MRITPTMEHGRDKNSLRLDRIEHEVGKTAKQRFACSQGDELAPFRSTPHAFDRSVEREQELEAQSPSLAFVPPKRVFQFPLGFRQEVNRDLHRPPSNLLLTCSHDEQTRGSFS